MDYLLDLDRDIFALVLEHDLFCVLVCTCKTFANRYSQEALDARLLFWHDCAPHLLHVVGNKVRTRVFVSDWLDINLCCETRHTYVQMVSTKCTSAKFKQTRHVWNYNAEVCADPHVVARGHGGFMANLPLKNADSEGHATGACDFFRRNLRCGRVAALKNTTDESVEQALEVLEVSLPREILVSVQVSGGVLRLKGSVHLCQLEMLTNTKSWYTAACRQPQRKLAVDRLKVRWHEAVFSATPTRVLFGVTRTNDGSDSDSDWE